MCGIIAYVGAREVRPVLIDGLRRLEYRGYDSAGLATLADGSFEIAKKAGRISELARDLGKGGHPARMGISHTRWATHGEPTDVNAHPHLDQSGDLALVHNGVVENYQALKRQLAAQGDVFHSATDTEVLAHLIGKCYAEEARTGGDRRLVEAVRRALQAVKGTYGVAVMHRNHPGLILGARRGSPLVLGLGEGEMFLCSDATALLPYTQKVVYLKDFDLAEMRCDSFTIETLEHEASAYEIQALDFTPTAAERGDFPHFMLKEIFEQPLTVENAIRGRLHQEENSAQLGGLNLTPQQLREIDRIIILGCGTALHAGMVGAHMLEDHAFLAAQTDHASEFRYRNCPVPRNTLFLAVSQSGETADTLGALREARRKGFRCLGLCNHVGSTIARESDGGIYMHAGPEIGVAATKSFLSQCAIFGLLTLLLGRMRHLSASGGRRIIEAFEALPAQISRILEANEHIELIAQKYCGAKSMLFLGRQANFPVALEAALKLKEISYIHAAGYPSAELKHGVIALIDRETPSVFLCPQDSLHDKNISSMQEVRARRGPIVAVATEGDEEIADHADDIIFVPRTIDMLQPLLNVVPLQLLAYHCAVALGRDVDKPRNLAKSVTVE
ncbi:MAG: glutamine--fructose-6-phosphate transaminase (isomerizing) [Verrucomicrobiales bacterium]|nr:glutamine--fructose-6-phosphate transaminase (isomerizing) [Verrucomicrobiales bacterium]